MASTIPSLLAVLGGLLCLPAVVQAQSMSGSVYTATVTSNLDASIQADQVLTLREAIAVQNGTLPMSALSSDEQKQVTPSDKPMIQFALPEGETTIELQQELPPLQRADLMVDGTSQAGYTDVPKVAITAKANAELGYGLAVEADRVTIKGLSLYGFVTDLHDYKRIEGTPQGDIIIVKDSRRDATPPEGVVIESNWLGSGAEGQSATFLSSFGVSVFNAIAPVIRNNHIVNHSGSGILTGVRASDMQIFDNILEDNGKVGMADGIRLEGELSGTKISKNTIRKSGGSAIYLFKSSGSIQIQDNTLENNSDRVAQAAIYLMGSGHEVRNNTIRNHNGSGVVVAAYPKSERNLIQDNQFENLKGLSIDLVATHQTEVTNYALGDGPNPWRNSDERRKDTGNAAINAPRFLAPEFSLQNGVVKIDGQADPGSEVVLYRVDSNDLAAIPGYATPMEALITVKVDEKGRFAADLEGLKVGDRLSAIAVDPRYGTSEPAAVLTIPEILHQLHQLPGN